MSRWVRGIFIAFVSIFLFGCVVLTMVKDDWVIAEQTGFTFFVSTSEPMVRISGGNLHWHKKLPDETYVLEDLAIEVQNTGDADGTWVQMELVVDGDRQLFDVGSVIPAGARQTVVVRPMMAGYDGGTHNIYIALLGADGLVLASNEQVVGPLAPVAGTGSWQPVPS